MADSVRALLAARAATAPEAPALLAPGRDPTSAAELLAHVDATAARLADAGITRADPVALALPNGPDLAVAFLGAVVAGVAAPLAADRPAAEQQRDLAAMGARLLVVQRGHDTPARAAAAELGIPVVELVPDAGAGRFGWGDRDGVGGAVGRGPDPGAAALLLFTSGTTSRPKLVPLTEANLLASTANVVATLGLTAADRCLGVMPLFHIHGLVAGLLASLAAGGSVVCTPGFSASSVWDWIGALRPTWYTAVPTIHQAMLEVSRPRATADRPVASTLEFVRSSSAALPVPVMLELEAVLGVPVVEAYGMTEAAHQIASNPRPPGVRRPGSVGRPVGCELAVHDDDGRPLPPGAVGELVIRGPSVTTGYLDAPEATAAAFRDGWFRTGDQGLVDADGFVTITGRLKEIINRGGEKVAPREVDDVLLAHRDVTFAAAFAVPHPRLGEEVAAAVVLRPGATVTGPGLRVFVADRLAAWKVPRRVVVVDEIPKGATGKLDRMGLAARLGLSAVGGGGSVPVEPADELEERVAAVWQQVLGEDVAPGVESDFFELGGDSLHATELLEEIERSFGRRLPATVFFDGATVRAMADLLRADPQDPHASYVVPVQPRGAEPPLFCVMRAGSVVALRHFARTLGPDQPVYGVWMPAMHGPADAAGTIEDIAATCVALVREVRPDGPYRLFGHSLGALVVYETARQLAAAGETVAFLGLADVLHPDVLRARWAHRHSTRYRLRKLLSRKGPGMIAWRVRQVLGRNPPPPVRYLPGTEAVVDWGAAFARERRYFPGPAPVPFVVFVTATYVAHAQSLDLGWASLMPPGSECVEVPGDHDSMIGEPHVHVLAARLRDCVRVAADRPA